MELSKQFSLNSEAGGFVGRCRHSDSSFGVDFDDHRAVGGTLITKVYKENTPFYLMPNDQSVSSKIIGVRVDFETSPWKLEILLLIDGNVYTRYVNFDS